MSEVLQVVAGLLINPHPRYPRERGLVLMQRRKATQLRPGLWEYPGGKVNEGEEHRAALVREWDEELGVTIEPDPTLLDRWNAFVECQLVVTLYQVRLVDDVIQRPIGQEWQEISWVDHEDAIRNLPMVPSSYIFYQTVHYTVETHLRQMAILR